MTSTHTPTLYDIIDVDPSASMEEVRKAHRRALRQTHPDMNDGRRSPRYLSVQEAGEVLLDEKRRADYDRSLGRAAQEPTRTEEPRRQTQNRHQNESESPTATTQDSRYTHDFPTIPVIRRWTAPTDDPVMFPKADYGEKSRPWRIGIGIVVALLILLAGIVTWQQLTPWGYLGFFSAITQGIGVGITTIVLVAGAFFAVVATVDNRGRGLATFIILIGALLVGWKDVDQFFLLAAAVINQVGLMVFRLSTQYRGEFIIEPNSLQYSIFGTPGLGLSQNTTFSQSNIEAGIKGERAGADALATLTDIPGLKIFHSCRFGTDTEADVDHVVVYGKKVALIDSKLWPSSDYRWQGDGSPLIIEEGYHGTRERKSNMDAAMRNYTALMPKDAKVRGWIMIHPRKGEENFSFSNVGAPAGLRMGDANEVVNAVAEWLLTKPEGTPEMDRVVLNCAAFMLKKEESTTRP